MEAKMIDRFLTYIGNERNRSPRTVESYDSDLRHFEAYFKELDSQLSWETIDSDVIRDWMESMMDKGNTATSICRRLSAVRSFYRFALSKGLVSRDPAYNVRSPKRKKPLPQFVKESEMNTLIDGIEWNDSFKDVRARTLILMFYSTGIRLAELVELNDTSIDFAAMQIKVRGKRNKERIVPFGEELAKAMRFYMARRDREFPYREAEGAFFVGKDGMRVKRASVQYEVKKRLTGVTTLKKRSPHVLRHTFATAMLNHQANMESVKKLLGHEKLSTTQIYTHVTFEQLCSVYSTAHPRATKD